MSRTNRGSEIERLHIDDLHDRSGSVLQDEGQMKPPFAQPGDVQGGFEQVGLGDDPAQVAVVVEQDVRAALGDLVYDTVIPRNVRLSEAPSHGLPALIYDQACVGSIETSP